MDSNLSKSHYRWDAVGGRQRLLEATEVDEPLFGMARHLTGEAPYDNEHLQNIVRHAKEDPTRASWSTTGDAQRSRSDSRPDRIPQLRHARFQIIDDSVDPGSNIHPFRSLSLKLEVSKSSGSSFVQRHHLPDVVAHW